MKGIIMVILVFGQLQDITGTDTLHIKQVEGKKQLSDALFELFPRLQETKFVIAIDREIIDGDAPIGPNACIALLPPFSGG